jgi:hypothetical protein
LWVAPSGRIMKPKPKPEAAQTSAEVPAEAPTKTAAEIDAEIKDTVDSICDAAKWTKTSPKKGAKAIEYLHVPADAIELLGELAALRGKPEEYTESIVKKWKVTFKDAQTTSDKSESSRSDTLDKDAKRKAFVEKVTKLFTTTESAATKNAKGMADIKTLWAELGEAQAAKDTVRVAELNAQIESVMTR